MKCTYSMRILGSPPCPTTTREQRIKIEGLAEIPEALFGERFPQNLGWCRIIVILPVFYYLASSTSKRLSWKIPLDLIRSFTPYESDVGLSVHRRLFICARKTSRMARRSKFTVRTVGFRVRYTGNHRLLIGHGQHWAKGSPVEDVCRTTTNCSYF